MVKVLVHEDEKGRSYDTMVIGKCNLPGILQTCIIIDHHPSFDFWVRIHQPFSRTFFVFVSKICKSECNTTSDWLNRTV